MRGFRDKDHRQSPRISFAFFLLRGELPPPRLTQEHLFYYNILMSLWQDLFSRLGFPPRSARRTYTLDADLYTALDDLAERENRPTDDVVSEMVSSGLNQWYSQENIALLWQSLSPREQDISALACLGYTNRQIAARLGISDETVKTHLHNALVKLNLHSRSEIRMLFAHWDFSRWNPQ
jgi:DNA-binding CsgD family transcriptional regulator